MTAPSSRSAAPRPAGSGSWRVRAVSVIGALVLLAVLSSCSWISGLFGGNDPDKGEPVSVFKIAVGDCFVAPAKVQAELSDLSRVPCSVPHQQEAFASIGYVPPDGSKDYPGNAALETFAKGSCAQKFTDYVGIGYPDSSLWLTYLLPSARSWQQGDDRSVWCFVTTTGAPLTESVKDSKL